MECWNCGRKGHKQCDCSQPSRQCHGCNRLGHMKKYCRTFRVASRPYAHGNVCQPQVIKPQRQHVETVNSTLQQEASSSGATALPSSTTNPLTQSCSSATKSRLTSNQITQVSVHIARWRECMRRSYPDFCRKPYFIPSVYQNKTSFTEVQRADQTILIPRQPVVDNKGQSAKLLQETDVSDDKAQRRVLHCLQAMATQHPQPMFILSQLKFSSYLNEPSYAAAASLFPRPQDLKKEQKDRGDFDILGILRDSGVLVAEIKSVGEWFQEPREGQTKPTEEDQDSIITKKLTQAIKQIDKSEDVLRHVTSDLPAKPRITKVFILPNVSRAQLERVIGKDSNLKQGLERCLQTADLGRHFLTCDELSDVHEPLELTGTMIRKLHDWWRTLLDSPDPDPAMTDDLYEDLVARFCGPATEVKLRTLGEGVALTGDQFTRLVLTPDQISILNNPDPHIFLTGPPGTGKTVLMIQKGVEWRHEGKDVHVISCDTYSAANIMVHHQLDSLAGDLPGKAYLHDRVGGGEKLLNQLEADAQAHGGSLCIVADECAYFFNSFCTDLSKRVPNMQVIAASNNAATRNVPSWMTHYKMNDALRTPPFVTALVHKRLRLAFKDGYKRSTMLFPTDGPQPMEVWHKPGVGGHVDAGEDLPCGQCALELASILIERLGVGTLQGLRFRDVFILRANKSLKEDSVFVQTLEKQGVPVRIEDEDDVKDMALMTGPDTVSLTKGTTDACGLERKVVCAITLSVKVGDDRVSNMSRCTSQLIRLRLHDDDDHEEEDLEEDEDEEPLVALYH